MAKQFFVSLVVASVLLMAAGCADNNPVSLDEPTSGSDGGIAIVALAKTAAVGDTSTDTVGVGVTVMFSAEISRISLRDSIISSTWDFGDGYTVACTNDSGICSVEHQYNTSGPYEVRLYVVLKGAAVRNPWKRMYVVNTSLLPSVTAQHDSILMYDTSEAIGTTGHWDVTFLIGVNSISAASARANVAVLRPFRNGGRDNEWSQNIAITSKTSDNKFYICKILDLTPGREYRFRLGLDVNNPSNTILSSSEFIRNRFYSTAQDVFEFSLKHNGQAVPKTTDYGTPSTPIDTGTTVTPIDSTKPTLIGQFGDTSLTNWVIRKEYVPASNSYTFYFNFKVTTKPIGQVASPAFVIANLHPSVNGGKESLTMMTGDSIGYFTVPVDSFPAEGLRMYQYGRGTAYRDFEGSLYAMPDKSVWIKASVAVLSKKAAVR